MNTQKNHTEMIVTQALYEGLIKRLCLCEGIRAPNLNTVEVLGHIYSLESDSQRLIAEGYYKAYLDVCEVFTKLKGSEYKRKKHPSVADSTTIINCN